jgi:hypothetical protein
VEANEVDGLRDWVSGNNVRVKIELSPVFRGALAPPVEMEVHAQVQETLGYATKQILQKTSPGSRFQALKVTISQPHICAM